MSLADPQHPRRHGRLSLPGYRPADAAPLAACATGAPADGHRAPATVPPVLARPEATRGHDPRALSQVNEALTADGASPEVVTKYHKVYVTLVDTNSHNDCCMFATTRNSDCEK